MPAVQRPPLLVSVHVPKTGGTSLLVNLREAYGSALYEDYQNSVGVPDSPAVFHRDWFYGLRHEAPVGAEAVHGHFNPLKYQHLEDQIVFTILRHPVDWIFSLYFYWFDAPKAGIIQTHVVDHELSIVEAAKIPLIRNFISRELFGGFDMARVDLIGRHEAMEESLSRLSALIGRPLRNDIRENQTGASPEREAMRNDPALRKALTDILSEEIDFFERYGRRDIG